jgi:CelD/BcsL family acetyltransferase involved in cellulose biosynthesis
LVSAVQRFTATFHPVVDTAALGERWLAFERQAACSFFQSWAWTGCLFAERFPDPLLLELRDDGRVVAMALFNRRRDWLGCERLWLGESGRPTLDTVFIEHNGPLSVVGGAMALRAILEAALQLPSERGWRWGKPWRRQVVLSGVGTAVRAAAAELGTMLVQVVRPAPYIDLTAIRMAGSGYLGSIGAGTRYQIRRSERRYAERGELRLRRAETVTEAHDFLDALMVLHQQTWVARGKIGAFANPQFLRFHHSLIDRASSEIDLLRVEAGEHIVGYLYNFRYRGRVSTYQSGFAYTPGETHRKPGLTCHHLAVEMYLTEGFDAYDFLAGEARYKRNLSNASTDLHWIEIMQTWLPAVLCAWVRDAS